MLLYLLCYQAEPLLLMYMLDGIVRSLQFRSHLLNSSSGLVYHQKPDKGQNLRYRYNLSERGQELHHGK